MTTALLVYAHLDDAEIFGTPFFTDTSITRKVLICSSDKTNPNRQSYARGEDSFAESCGIVGITDFRVLPFWSSFYALRTRGKGDGPTLMDWWNATTAAIREMAVDCDWVATDNPWGSYGHSDHLMVRRAVLHTVNVPVRWTTSMAITTTWPCDARATPCHDRCRMVVSDVHNDPVLLERLKACYTSRGAWTWDRPIPEPGVIMEELTLPR